MIWLALGLAIVIALAVGLFTHNWKRAFLIGLGVLILGIIAAVGYAYMEWWVISNS